MTDRTENDVEVNRHFVTERLETSERPFGLGLVCCGIGIVVGFLLVLIGWSFLAPLESAVIASGVVSSEFPHKTIQHLEGGTVDSIHVQDGDFVKTGTLLFRLDDTVLRATRNRVRAEYIESLATEARLTAERDGQPSISFPEELLLQGSDPLVLRAMAAQQDIMDTRRKSREGLRAMLQHRSTGSSEELDMLRNQISSLEKQLALTEEEQAIVSKLVAQHVADKPRLLVVQRKVSEIQAKTAEALASLARLQRNTKEARFALAEWQAGEQTNIIEQLMAVSGRVRELKAELTSAEDILQRTAIRSPIDGTVMGLHIHNTGGVIVAGQPLLDIVPTSDTLVVEASIDPRDIEQVKPGLPAQVQITAFNRRTRSPVSGEVVTVSADTLPDSSSGARFYHARISLNEVTSGSQISSLRPGMGADVMIQTGSRTAAEYLLMPIRRSLDKAMREN